LNTKFLDVLELRNEIPGHDSKLAVRTKHKAPQLRALLGR
jgi:hypothetical protein